jgi:arylsulfatase A-like enzyme
MHLRMWINSYRLNYEEGHMVHVYDYLVRVPLVIRWPQRLPPGSHAAMVRQPDILPTLLDLLGIEFGEAAPDGRSFRPLLEGRPFDPPPAFLSVSGCPLDLEIRGVRTATHKFTYGPYNDDLPQELYDLRADPGETCNLAGSQPERSAELRALADRLAGAAAAAAEGIRVNAREQAAVESHLRALGYLE